MKNIAVCMGLLTLAISFGYAQKLPTVQQGGIRAAAGIKIDGKATEWGDKYQAYNKNIEAFYTISNDDEKLYLTLKATTHDVVDKIIRGGLTLIINHTTKKNDPEAVSITYPVVRNADMSVVANMFAGRSYRQDDGITRTEKDMNNIFESKAKIIEVKGIKTISDNELSVYNDEGIKAVGMFDDKNAYTYELAIPLKYLNLPNNGTDSFSYHIKANEIPQTHIAAGGPPPPPMIRTQLATTDFWGEYTLAKK